MTKAEQIAFDAGKTAKERIGDKAMCYDEIMENLLTEARSERGHERNRKLMNAWLIGRGWNELCC